MVVVFFNPMPRRARLIVLAAIPLLAVFAQIDVTTALPLRSTPAEKLTVNLGFRDWGPATVAGSTVIAGNQTGRGGLFAIDATTGKARWTYRPVFSSGTASVSTVPAVVGSLVITPFAAAHPGAVIAVSLTTGKEVWRGPDPEQGAGVAVDGDFAYILAKGGSLFALDAVTGRERWKADFGTNLAPCASQPLVKEGVIYLTGVGKAIPGDPARPAGYYLFALDAKTGQERWRYRADAPYVHPGVCLNQPVLTADTVFATGDNYLYAVARATGRNRWPPVEVRRSVEGRERGVRVQGLVDAGAVLVGITTGYLIAFSKDTGRATWEIPGQYRDSLPAAVAGSVLYFQGSPNTKPAPDAGGTLHALDLETRQILWSFFRPTAERNWPFGHIAPVNGGLWVNSYQTLVKLE
jgi:outer membrane protein assembly factor BamB